MIIGPISWFAVVVAAVASMVIGAVWYSKSVFGKAWMDEVGLTDAKMKAAQKKMMQMYAIGFVVSVLMAYVLSGVVTLAGSETIGSGVVTGFWVWLGLQLPLSAGSVLWEGKSQRWLSITAGYQLVSTVVMAALLSVL